MDHGTKYIKKMNHFGPHKKKYWIIELWNLEGVWLWTFRIIVINFQLFISFKIFEVGLLILCVSWLLTLAANQSMVLIHFSRGWL